MGVQNGLLTDITTPSEYVGYSELNALGTVEDIILDDALVNEAQADTTVQVIFDKTPFYAEMGGQVADKGLVKDEDGNVVAEVMDVQHAPNGQNMHTLKLRQKLAKGMTYRLEVNREFHNKVKKNHTATHLLDQALRDVLGEHTHQAGSLVEPNAKIWANLPVETVVTDLESAQKMGAIALFGDKYGDTVRVVKAGDYSMEFCGGNHVDNTNELGLFKIVSESGVGAGVRRIEAVTSKEAFEFLEPRKVEALQAQIKELEQQKQALEAKFASQQAQDIFKDVAKVNDHTLIVAKVNVSGMDQLRQLADQWKEKDLSEVLVLATAPAKDKVNLIVGVSDAGIKAGIKAGDLIKDIAPLVGGGGGGRPNLAQAGGKNPAGIGEALAKAKTWLADK